jgi:hypothetical protein
VEELFELRQSVEWDIGNVVAYREGLKNHHMGQYFSKML